MANYYIQIHQMIEKLMHKVLLYDRKGFRIDTKEDLSLLDLYVLRKIGSVDSKKIYELIDEIQLDRGLMASVIKKLALSGYIAKEKAEDDRRVYRLMLTSRGKQVYKNALIMEQKLLSFMLEDVTVNEEKAILKFLSKINQIDWYVKRQMNDQNKKIITPSS